MERGLFVVAGIALMLASAAVGWQVGRSGVELPPAPECPPAPDVAKLCAELQPNQRTVLEAAQIQVTTLTDQLAAREKELADAQSEAEKASDQKQAAATKAKRLEAEVATLKGQLEAARTERDKLLTDLRDTVARLDEQVRSTESAREEARSWQGRTAGEQWSRLLAEAKVEICEKGTIKRHESCHTAVEAAFTPAIKERFVGCVGSGQAVPALRQLGKGETLPKLSLALADDKAFTSKGWYLLMCDPTLPEAGSPPAPTLTPVPAPKATPIP